MTQPVTVAWSVDDAMQRDFVALSGDRNPLHLDPIVARRLPFGRVAVHGMHLALDALERLTIVSELTPRRVRATFRHPVGIGDPIVTEIDATDPAGVVVRVTTDVWTAAELRVTLGPATTLQDGVIHTPPDGAPIVRGLESLRGMRGSIPIAVDPDVVAHRFPELTSRLGEPAVAQFATITRLIGMEVPGLRSMLSSFDVSIGDASHAPHAADTMTYDTMRYAVTTVDERFSRVVLDVAGPTISGTATAFVRADPVDQQPDTSAVDPGEFAAWRVLVVGGSRGLGAACVTLLAAGGAEVRFTYHHGEDDAAGVAAASGATAHRLDVLAPDQGLAAIAADGWAPTHLAYFASPPIFVGMPGAYSPTLAARFRAVYVDAFERIVESFDPERLSGVLWPSSRAVDAATPGLAEYADAKSAGEAVCAGLAAEHPRLVVRWPRLPRLLTDQSTSFVPTEFGDTASELLAALRSLAR